jgi:hypothetical protein
MTLFRWIYSWLLCLKPNPGGPSPERPPTFVRLRKRMGTNYRDVRVDKNGKPIFIQEVRSAKRYL